MISPVGVMIGTSISSIEELLSTIAPTEQNIAILYLLCDVRVYNVYTTCMHTYTYIYVHVSHRRISKMLNANRGHIARIVVTQALWMKHFMGFYVEMTHREAGEPWISC